MADKADKKEAQDDDKEKSGGAPSTTKIILFAVLLSVVLSGVMVGAAMYFLSDDGDQAAAVAADNEEADAEETEAPEDNVDPDAPPQYVSMDPKFVVSFIDEKKARFMQFSLQVMTRDDDVIKLLEKHMPAVRSSLLMLVGSQEYAKVSTRDGKEELLAEITADINRTLEKIAGKSGVEASYFDSFVVQ